MIEFSDIQGILLRGYPKLTHARYLLLRFGDAAAGRSWVADVAERVRRADQGPPMAGTCLQIAFTWAGLRHLGLSEQALKGFSREFREGIAGSARRVRVLGYRDESAPERWQWGGPNNRTLHAVLMLFAKGKTEIAAFADAEHCVAGEADISVLEDLPACFLPGDKEHFGFRDGISQPKLAGVSASTDPMHVVAPGEFILGYPNQRGDVTAGPTVHAIEDPDDILPPLAHAAGRRDLGRNGSYLVFNQLSQDVHGFWSWIDGRTRDADGNVDPAARDGLAAKMVGRWPGGAPLTVSPERDAPESAGVNDFGYHQEDEAGLRCPLGAHIRRTNPRDMLPPRPGTEDSLAINRRHRLLRRGRPYGPPVADTFAAEDILAAGADGANKDKRGLHFLCFNASIQRQFEFVQGTWANNPNFAALHADTDPIIGARPAGAATFTQQATPVRRRFHEVPRFVEVKGGAYFFLPGIRALRYLAREPRRLADEYSAPAAEPVVRPTPRWLTLARRVNAVLEGAVTVTRRFTLLRNALDRLLQQPLTDLVQWLIQRRRAKRGADADLAIAEERTLPAEADVTRRIAEQMTAFLFTHYRTGTAERAGNTKTYALLRASFEIEPRLNAALRHGVFVEGRSYDAWVRLSGPGPLVTPDIRNNGVLSIGVKLTGVPGPKLLDEEHLTQDFTGISAPTFTTPDIYENLKLQQYLGAGIPTFYFLNPLDPHYLDMILQGIYAKAHGSPLETPYWSCVPYLCGEGQAMKYSFVPQSAARTRVPLPAPDDYLRDAVAAGLRTEVCFDFRVQLQTDPAGMPIEDASVIWTSDSVKVATLRLPPQDFVTPERELMARQMSFNPWHAVAAHRPLGNQNRARRRIYLETSAVRRRINDEEHVEP